MSLNIPDAKDSFDKLKNSSHAIVLTGAGVSTLSGIPDFRGKNGLFCTNSTFEEFPVEEMFYADFFINHPDVFYRYARDFWYPIMQCSPSIAHKTIATLEKQNIIKKVYTQNIDTLHTKAGSKKVEELPGSFSHHRCVRCLEELPFNAVMAALEKSSVPYCPRCNDLVSCQPRICSKNCGDFGIVLMVFRAADTGVSKGRNSRQDKTKERNLFIATFLTKDFYFYISYYIYLNICEKIKRLYRFYAKLSLTRHS